MSQPHRGERRLDRVRGPQVRPVLRLVVVEAEEDFSVLLEARHRLRVLHLELLHEEVTGRKSRLKSG